MVDWDEKAKLERELQQGFSRRPAPAGFADRVMARVEADAKDGRGKAGRPAWMRAGVVSRDAQPWLRWGIAAVLLLVIGGGVAERERKQQRAAQDASRQTELALRITAEKLQHVQQQMQALEDGGGAR